MRKKNDLIRFRINMIELLQQRIQGNIFKFTKGKRGSHTGNKDSAMVNS